MIKGTWFPIQNCRMYGHSAWALNWKHLLKIHTNSHILWPEDLSDLTIIVGVSGTC